MYSSCSSLPPFSPHLSSVFLSKFHSSAQFHWAIMSCISPFIIPRQSSYFHSLFSHSPSLFSSPQCSSHSLLHTSAPHPLCCLLHFFNSVLSSLLYLLRFCSSLPLTAPFRSGHSILISPSLQIREHKFSFPTVRLKVYSLHQSELKSRNITTTWHWRSVIPQRQCPTELPLLSSAGACAFGISHQHYTSSSNHQNLQL